MNNGQVIESFLKKEKKDSKNLHSDGRTLKSYSMTIASWEDDGMVLVPRPMLPSHTTRCHYGALQRALTRTTIKVQII